MKDKVHGEGNYAASRKYNEASRKFAHSGKVDKAARSAAPANPKEAAELKRAEEAGKRRSRGEDPELYETAQEDELRDELRRADDFDRDDSDR